MTKFKKGNKVLVECVVVAVSPEITNVIIEYVDKYANNVQSCIDASLISTQPTWIPVEDGLPESLGVDYLCQVVDQEKGSCYQCVAWRSFEKTWIVSITDKREDITSRVVAWQPLPAPYVPPVKLRESCHLCSHNEIFVYQEGGKGSFDICHKHKNIACFPHLINNKPCHED